MEISSTYWSPDVTNWWCQPEEPHSKYTDFPNVVRDIIFIIPLGVGVEAGFSLGWDVNGWRQSRTTSETIRDEDVVRQFAWANNRILGGDCAGLFTASADNNLELKKEAEKR